MKKQRTGILLMVLLVMGLLAGCGSDDPYANSQGPCFEQPSGQDALQLQQYMNAQGNQSIIAQDIAGDPEVCVIDQNTGQMHYYHRNDGFQNYILMSMMYGRVHPLIGYGVISGDIDPMTAMIMNNLLVNTNRDGYLYHPYSYNANSREWNPNTTVINKTVVVKNVYYGNSTAPVNYKKSFKAAPRGYTTQRFAKPNDRVASVSSSGSSAKVSTLPGVSASKVRSNGGKIPTVKTNPGGNTGPTFKNPNGGTGNQPKPRPTYPRSTTRPRR
ncbi:MAG TPA: hypothetical protein VLF59_06110 [Candidatus Saccharimonadales bacterium]|nr:hypothetical protein [Candidatus Saccharimonadales bacterium]